MLLGQFFKTLSLEENSQNRDDFVIKLVILDSFFKNYAYLISKSFDTFLKKIQLLFASLKNEFKMLH
jgi:hypothetical protein